MVQLFLGCRQNKSNQFTDHPHLFEDAKEIGAKTVGHESSGRSRSPRSFAAIGHFFSAVVTLTGQEDTRGAGSRTDRHTYKGFEKKICIDPSLHMKPSLHFLSYFSWYRV